MIPPLTWTSRLVQADVETEKFVDGAHPRCVAFGEIVVDGDDVDAIAGIDEFTGRMMQGRRYSEGLHQALEAKEHVTIQPENQD